MTIIDEKEVLEIEKLKVEVRKLTLETHFIPYELIIKLILGATALLGAGKYLL